MFILIKHTVFLGPHTNSTIRHCSFRPSLQRTYVNLIKRFSQTRSLIQGKSLHARLIIAGLARLTHFAYKLIGFYLQCKQLPTARKLFDKIPQRNLCRWVVLIGAYSKNGLYQEALRVFSEMVEQGLRPGKFVVPSVLKACGHVFDLRLGKVLHGVVLKDWIERDVFVVSSLIDMYGKCGEVKVGRKVFDGMVERDLVALNSMVSGYVQSGFVGKGYDLVEEIRVSSGIKPNVVTWNTLIIGFAQEGDEAMISKVFELMRLNGVEMDVISWTSVISGFVQNFQNGKAFNMFRSMLRCGFYPTSNTISSLLPACSTVANVRHGKELHRYAVMVGVESDLYVSSALLDMYAKCGFIYEARMLFCKMPERSTVTWNSMIFGYSNHGYCNEAVELFNQMDKEDGKKVNHLTFTAVLTACSHAGMVDLGKSLFLLMQEKYRILPRLEHHACLVDILGKSDKLAEAYDMIKKMPIKPDLFVWGALLGACRSHGDVDLAEIAARHLAELEPRNAGNSMILKNLYADTGHWDSVARFKKLAKKNKFKKYSWLHLGSRFLMLQIRVLLLKCASSKDGR